MLLVLVVEISGGGDSAGREPRPNVIMVTPGPGKEPNTPEVPNSDVQVSRGSVSSMFNQHSRCQRDEENFSLRVYPLPGYSCVNETKFYLFLFLKKKLVSEKKKYFYSPGNFYTSENSWVNEPKISRCQ